MQVYGTSRQNRRNKGDSIRCGLHSDGEWSEGMEMVPNISWYARDPRRTEIDGTMFRLSWENRVPIAHRKLEYVDR